MLISRFRLTVLLGLVVFAGVACDGAPPATPTNPPAVTVGAPAQAIDILSIGDWGRDTQEERAVAKAMAAYVAKSGHPFQACLLAGDNFYVKLDSIEDAYWKTLFEDMYDRNTLAMPFFVALGNHDFEGNKAQIELDYAKAHPDSRWKFPARYYRIDIPSTKPLVTILMLDSNQPKLSAAEWDAQTRWMDEQLAAVPPGVWKVCCAHHPLFSNGSHGDNGVMQTQWGPVFLKRGVDFFVCGHDHDLQHLEIQGHLTSFLLIGGGGAGVRPMRRDDRGPFSRSTWGFGHVCFAADKATVRFVDLHGLELHAFERTRTGAITVLLEGGNDKPTTKPLKAVQGLD